uniref:protein-serine/threonine phosphatase n=1 Tax=Zea mays TaxID=4577 RepID=A0A804PA90_MAIZE
MWMAALSLSGYTWFVAAELLVMFWSRCKKLRRSRRLDAVQSDCSALSIIKQGDLMIVANVGDSRVVLGIAFDDNAIMSSSSSST